MHPRTTRQAARQSATRQVPAMASRVRTGPVHRAAEDPKPKKIPEDKDQVGKFVTTIDNPPSPADVPEDMIDDPGGEGTPDTPGITPPIPAPVPDTEVKKDNEDGLDYLLPLGGDNKL